MRNIICQLLEAYDIQNAQDIQDALKALYLATFEAARRWTMPMPIRNWGRIYGELSIMYEGWLPE